MLTLRIGGITLMGLAATLQPNYSHAKPLDRLPFADGTYVTDRSLCGMPMDAVLDRFGDRVGLMVINISGRLLDNGYEMYCEVDRVRSDEKSVTFTMSCKVEGETEVSEMNWEIVDTKRFKSGNRLYSYCGGFIM